MNLLPDHGNRYRNLAAAGQALASTRRQMFPATYSESAGLRSAR